MGGSRGRREATGRGVMFICDESIKKLKMRTEDTRVIIQGFGNVGSNAAMPDAPCRLQSHRHR